MPTLRPNSAGEPRLRFVFDDGEVSFDLAAGATFGDIARKVCERALRRRGAPVAIDVAWTVPGRPRPLSSLRRHVEVRPH